MSKTILKLFIVCLTLAITVSSCYYDNKEDLYVNINTTCDTSSVTFGNQISGIMSQSCAISGCHDASTTAAGLNLSEYQDVKISADKGTLVDRINGIGGNLMPLGGQELPDCEILQIETWVLNGAPNN
jgi:hypothetical protein